jgi:hypothetical protein
MWGGQSPSRTVEPRGKERKKGLWLKFRICNIFTCQHLFNHIDAGKRFGLSGRTLYGGLNEPLITQWDFRLSRQRVWRSVFWVVAPYSLVEVYWRLRGTFCLHHQGVHSPDDGGSKHIWNVGKRLPVYTTQQPGRQSTSLLSFPQIKLSVNIITYSVNISWSARKKRRP